MALIISPGHVDAANIVWRVRIGYIYHQPGLQDWLDLVEPFHGRPDRDPNPYYLFVLTSLSLLSAFACMAFRSEALVVLQLSSPAPIVIIGRKVIRA
jgi:hypothetical protein